MLQLRNCVTLLLLTCSWGSLLNVAWAGDSGELIRLASTSTPSHTTATDRIYAHYGPRAVDITSYVDAGDSFVRGSTNGKDGSLVYIAYTRQGPQLLRTAFHNGQWHPDRADTVFKYGKRSLWDPTYNPRDGMFYVVSDDYNDETFNIYRVNLDTQQLDLLTHQGYLGTFGFSADFTRILSVGRKDKLGKDAYLFETAIASPNVDKVLWRGNDEYEVFNYVKPREESDTKQIAFAVSVKGNRSRLNVALYTPHNKDIKVITDREGVRSTLDVLGWINGQLYYVANNGERNPSLYEYDPTHNVTTERFKNVDFPSLFAVLDPSRERVFLAARTADQSRGVVVIKDLRTNSERVVASDDIELFEGWGSIMPDGSLAIAGTNRKDTATNWFFHVDPNQPDDGKVLTAKFGQPRAGHRTPSYQAKEIFYETFDRDPATNAPRQLQAILFTPTTSRGTKRAALVYAHGGPTGRSTIAAPSEVEYLCELGYTVLAPNPRGSSGFGQRFEDLNNFDWGGGDWMDYEYGRQYLVSAQHIEPSRIGITGGSYGGYMTNWAMTRVGNKFAFGISDYGMADLLSAVKTSVVPDNFTSDLGDPGKNESLYKERSPIYGAANVNRPFFLTSGSRDFRSYFGETRKFVEEMRRFGKTVRYLELPGEGHAYRYPDTLATYYTEVAKFLFEVAPIGDSE